jgi:CheY-like chemotaxis protein
MNDFVLAADDEESDRLLLIRAFKLFEIPIPIQVVKNGEEVVAYLSGAGRYADRNQYPIPTVILLDIKMPRMDGFDVLEWIKRNPQYSVVPTIVWSSSRMLQDVKKAYELGANAYLQKPSSLHEIQSLMELTFRFWSIAEKPSQRNDPLIPLPSVRQLEQIKKPSSSST